MLPSAEIDTVEIFTPEIGRGFTLEWTAPSLYAVLSGSWSINAPEGDSSGSDSSRSLHPGDALIFTQPLTHQLVYKSPDSLPSGESQCLRIGFHWADHGQETRFHQLPPMICSRNLLLLSSRRSLAEASLAESPVPQQGLIRTLSQLLIGQVIGTQSHLLISNDGAKLDPEVEQSIRALEQNPGQPWTIERMAEVAGISRSALAQKFKEQVGQTPSEHLLNIRMQLADRMLKDRRHHLKEIARRSGYQSVSAFSTAFKRWSGSPPSAYRKGAVNPE